MPRNGYPLESRERAVELARTSGRPLAQIAKELGVSSTGLQRWVNQAKIETGEKPRVTIEDHTELVKLRRNSSSRKLIRSTAVQLGYIGNRRYLSRNRAASPRLSL